MHSISPNNWYGLLVVIGTILGSMVWVALLFQWDNPDRTREQRDADILSSVTDMFRKQ